MIKIQIIGHLGNDAQVNQVNGKQVINFSVCHTEKYRDATGNQKEKAYWVNCSYFSESRVAPYMKKGGLIYCEGKPEAKIWNDRAGNAQVQQTMIVSSIQLLSGNNTSQQQSSPSSSSYTVSEAADIDVPLENLPF